MSLFQNAVISKYLQATNQDVLSQKWNDFVAFFHNPERQENIRNSKEEQFQEGFLRELFVKILGYTLNPEPNFNLTTEYKNVKDSKKADGAIIVSEKVRAVIELKGTNTTDLGKIEAQAFGYKNNQPDCTYVITSNFEKIRFYIDNAIEHLEFNLFTLTEAEFKILYLCLAIENISKNIPKKVKEESVSQEDVITKKLYKDYSLFKRELFQNLVQLNPNFDQLELFKKSQKLLDRFLFIFFAEDRMLLPPNSVRLILQQWKQLQDLDEYTPLYDRFKKYFGYLNTGYKGKNYDVYAYNGGLFKPDDILDNITIDDNLLYTHTIKLSEYDFVSEVDVNILGHIFENSLNELDEIKAQLAGQEIDKTKTKRKKDGVFYTPKYITKYIVENTVGKLCEEQKTALAINEEDYITDKKRQKKTIKDLVDKLETYRKWLLQLTICDPACGSGAFLNQALDFLMEEHQYIDELQAKLFGDALVLTDMENSILENNLFGVDLNEESVEIAKLSLWLRTAQPNRKLNDLSGNIKCGNSLIDDPEIAGEKAFNWQTAFPKVFEKGGFDIIIGNPPWGAKVPKNHKDFINKKFICKKGELETYVHFIDLIINRLIKSENGLMSLITPNTWYYLDKYIDLRRFLLDKNIVELIELEKNIFEDAPDIVPAIFTIQNNAIQNKIITHSLKKGIVPKFLIDNNIMESNIIDSNDYKKFDDLTFNLKLTKSKVKLLEKIRKDSKPLKTSYNVRYGIKTGNNNKYLSKINEGSENWKLCVSSASGVKRYSLNWEGDFLNFGNHLAGFSNNSFERKKILIQYIRKLSMERRIVSALDKDGKYYPLNNFSFVEEISEENSVEYVQGILNSNLMNFYFKNIHIDYNIKPKYIEKLPLKFENILKKSIENKVNSIITNSILLSETSTKFQRTLQRKFEGLEINKKLESWYELTFAEFVKELGKKKIKLSLSEEAEWEDYFLQEQQKALALKQQITTTDQEIDKMVYELYGLTDEEISIVENS